MEDSKVRVNLGCGAHIIKGWINIDVFYTAPSPNVDFVIADITKEIPLESNSVDYILCDQVLEHIKMSEVPTVLYNIKRVLKPGGEAIIVVPDFEDAVKQWLAYDHNLAFNPMTYQWLSEVVYGNQAHEGEFHKTPMCGGYLHYVLNMVGLTKHEILVYPANGSIPQFPGIDYPDNACLRNGQLVVKITKS